MNRCSELVLKGACFFIYFYVAKAEGRANGSAVGNGVFLPVFLGHHHQNGGRGEGRHADLRNGHINKKKKERAQRKRNPMRHRKDETKRSSSVSKMQTQSPGKRLEMKCCQLRWQQRAREQHSRVGARFWRHNFDRYEYQIVRLCGVPAPKHDVAPNFGPFRADVPLFERRNDQRFHRSFIHRVVHALVETQRGQCTCSDGKTRVVAWWTNKNRDGQFLNHFKSRTSSVLFSGTHRIKSKDALITRISERKQTATDRQPRARTDHDDRAGYRGGRRQALPGQPPPNAGGIGDDEHAAQEGQLADDAGGGLVPAQNESVAAVHHL